MSRAKTLIETMMDIWEMARVGDIGPYSIWIYHEPLKNPSFHLRYKNDFEIVLQMKNLTILEIKFNNTHNSFEKGKLPPKNILKLIKEFLKLSNAKNNDVTNYQAMNIIWNSLNY
jgi:hypothetical protein